MATKTPAAKTPVVAAPAPITGLTVTTAPTLYALTATGAAMALKGGVTTQRNMEHGKVVWRAAPGGKVQGPNLRANTCATLASLPQPFTSAAALAALATAPLGAGGKPGGWLGWAQRAGHIAPAK